MIPRRGQEGSEYARTRTRQQEEEGKASNSRGRCPANLLSTACRPPRCSRTTQAVPQTDSIGRYGLLAASARNGHEIGVVPYTRTSRRSRPSVPTSGPLRIAEAASTWSSVPSRGLSAGAPRRTRPPRRGGIAPDGAIGPGGRERTHLSISKSPLEPAPEHGPPKHPPRRKTAPRTQARSGPAVEKPAKRSARRVLRDSFCFPYGWLAETGKAIVRTSGLAAGDGGGHRRDRASAARPATRSEQECRGHRRTAALSWWSVWIARRAAARL